MWRLTKRQQIPRLVQHGSERMDLLKVDIDPFITVSLCGTGNIEYAHKSSIMSAGGNPSLSPVDTKSKQLW